MNDGGAGRSARGEASLEEQEFLKVRLERAWAFLGSLDPLELLRGWEAPTGRCAMSD